MKQPLFTKSQKLSSVIDANPAIPGIMTRMNMGFAIGESSVGEACKQYGVDADTFLLVCNIYSFKDFIPSAKDIESAKTGALVDYLLTSHNYFLDKALGDLASAIAVMMEPCDETRRKVVRGFYNDYKQELEKHFEFEEKKVFPFVRQLIPGSKKNSMTYKRIEDNHSKIEEKITDLKNIVMKYLPKECNNSYISSVLMKIFFLEYDLERHSAVEDLLLVPMMKKMSEDGGEQ